MSAPAVGVRVPFGFLHAGHPAEALVGRLLGAVPQRLADLPRDRVRVVAELRGELRAGRWAPERFSCSLQARDPRTGAFDAWTAHWSAGMPDAVWSRLPDDPKLPGLATALAGPGTGTDEVEVLRYVPLRRFTYRQHGRVVKVKRRSRLDDSWQRAGAVETAAQRDRRVRVPALLGVDPVSSSYTQAAVPGVELADLACGDQLPAMLAEAGAVHAAFHTLDLTGVPEGPSWAAVRTVTERSAAWAAWLLPDLADVLARAVARLAALTPGPVEARDLVSCHGDLVPSHLLGGPGEWTVIDHDLAHRGDRYRDLAMFVAGLAFDVPALADGVAADPTHAAAVQAYLGGYQAGLGRRLDRDRLARHLLAAHLHHAALLATKDRVHPAAVAATAARLEAALDAVGGRR